MGIGFVLLYIAMTRTLLSYVAIWISQPKDASIRRSLQLALLMLAAQPMADSLVASVLGGPLGANQVLAWALARTIVAVVLFCHLVAEYQPPRVRAVVAVGLFSIASITFDSMTQCFVAETFFIPTNSMNPAIQQRDCILVQKFRFDGQFGRLLEPMVGITNPKRGDIVIFQDFRGVVAGTGQPNRTTHTKRCVALPGDTVQTIDGKPYVNGKLVAEDYVLRTKREGRPGIPDFEQYQLKEDEYFVLSDNRDNGLDSRAFGPVLRSEIRGLVLARYWPISRIGSLVQ